MWKHRRMVTPWRNCLRRDAFWFTVFLYSVRGSSNGVAATASVQDHSHPGLTVLCVCPHTGVCLGSAGCLPDPEFSAICLIYALCGEVVHGLAISCVGYLSIWKDSAHTWSLPWWHGYRSCHGGAEVMTNGGTMLQTCINLVRTLQICFNCW